MNTKPIHDLKPADFKISPIWVWVDDDNLVKPATTLDDLSDSDAAFVLAEFQFADQTTGEGSVAIRLSDKRVYLVSFVLQNGTLFDLPLQKEIKDMVTRERLCHVLGRGENELFPIEFKTSAEAAIILQLHGTIDSPW